jgi:hypothetical protein
MDRDYDSIGKNAGGCSRKEEGRREEGCGDMYEVHTDPHTHTHASVLCFVSGDGRVVEERR